MTSNKLSTHSSHGSSGENTKLWQALDRDFAFDGVDEEQLRAQTEQWLTCASEILGPPPSRAKKKTKR